MLNVGMGGAYIAVRGQLSLGPVALRVTVGAEALSFEARVVRGAGIDPKDSRVTFYGVEFDPDGATQSRLRLLVDRVRSPGVGAPPRLT